MAAIEAAAARRFDDIGMPHIASSPPTDLADLRERIDDDRALVAFDAEGLRIVGFAIYRMLGASRLYLEEVDVAPEQAGRRIGSALIEAVAARARAAGARQVVLSTFRHVPWNAPYYRRLGFVELDGNTLGIDGDTRDTRRARARRIATRVHGARGPRIASQPALACDLAC